ncbi:MAG: SGNH/GDSL hydrolase family protein, partial [Bryobacteraceae bacterium]|nr:SGNH/GDSL hydrolase family protein [Bryobacteraceae bacterium]
MGAREPTSLRTNALYFAAVTWCSLVAPVLAQDPFHLKDQDRVVFFGDSITDQRLYTTFVETYAITRFPDLRFTFIHSGWGGDRVTGGGGGSVVTRLNRDVMAYKPNVVTVMLGMNDGRYRAFDEQIFSIYSNGFKNIIKRLKTDLHGVRITAIQPSPYDDVTRTPTFPGGYNKVLLRY